MPLRGRRRREKIIIIIEFYVGPSCECHPRGRRGIAAQNLELVVVPGLGVIKNHKANNHLYLGAPIPSQGYAALPVARLVCHSWCLSLEGPLPLGLSPGAEAGYVSFVRLILRPPRTPRVVNLGLLVFAFPSRRRSNHPIHNGSYLFFPLFSTTLGPPPKQN